MDEKLRPVASSQEEYIYRRALESIRAELTSFDPDGDDVHYDRENAVVEVLKIIKIVLGPDEDEQEGLSHG
jgi:hypothetical protein